jgi:hypothetical protein
LTAGDKNWLVDMLNIHIFESSIPTSALRQKPFRSGGLVDFSPRWCLPSDC